MKMLLFLLSFLVCSPFLNAKTPDPVILSGVYLYRYEPEPLKARKSKPRDAIEKVEYILLDHPFVENGHTIKAVQVQWKGDYPKDLQLGDVIEVEGRLMETQLPSQRFGKMMWPMDFRNLSQEPHLSLGEQEKAPHKIVLSGTYSYLYAYGPPNFGEEKSTDQIEKVEYILLDHPFVEKGAVIKAVQVMWDLGKMPTNLRVGDIIEMEGSPEDSVAPAEHFRKTVETIHQFRNLSQQPRPTQKEKQ